ncbi:MAG TPA: peptidoglycan DD-metalloendopeptidase family protein [Terriglobia bacterium]|nr:peptidoglycan DD-metalloendopeptidase family protein [Terriglobia bacterium]
MNLEERASVRILVVLLLGLFGVLLAWQLTNPTLPQPVLSAPAAIVPAFLKETIAIRPGDTLDNLLQRSGVEAPLRLEMIAAIGKAFDVRKFRAGAELILVRTREGELRSLEYLLHPDRKLRLLRGTEGFAAEIAEIPGVIRTEAVCGTLRGSLFESFQRIGERPELAMKMAEIFAWDLDFYRDPREGDTFCLLVEKKEYAHGAPPTYRRVLAARYDNDGTVYDAFLFESEDGSPHYYSSSGESLQAAFRRSPLAFDARISSSFSRRRFHPVLGVYRPHLGTDYAAPTGTPILAVADGRVVFAGRSGGSGNMVTLQHANGFETQYLHMSRILVSKGERVRQGERIGLVGMTGLATGPHVDLRISKNGRYLNWETLKVPRQSRIPKAQEAAFRAVRDRWASQMAAGGNPALKLASSEEAPAPTP